mmetsp:Transcript_10818/g.18511  ORF Transcript_10818/g.18511 Transcript_10818/m.18511 type:complete len:143 (+) Transcript_10818:264-692(+)
MADAAGSNAAQPPGSNGGESSVSGDAGMCTVRFLLVNDTNFTWKLESSSLVSSVKKRIVQDKPQELISQLEGAGQQYPEAPDQIRFLMLGKLLEDGKTLKDYNFGTGPENVTTVHISIKADTAAATQKAKSGGQSNECCVIN